MAVMIITAVLCVVRFVFLAHPRPHFSAIFIGENSFIQLQNIFSQHCCLVLCPQCYDAVDGVSAGALGLWQCPKGSLDRDTLETSLTPQEHRK